MHEEPSVHIAKIVPVWSCCCASLLREGRVISFSTTLQRLLYCCARCCLLSENSHPLCFHDEIVCLPSSGTIISRSPFHQDVFHWFMPMPGLRIFNFMSFWKLSLPFISFADSLLPLLLHRVVVRWENRLSLEARYAGIDECRLASNFLRGPQRTLSMSYL